MSAPRDPQEYAIHAEAVGLNLLGDINQHASKKGRELRWGKGGSMALDLRKGTFYDHENTCGGGVMWLIEQKLGLKGDDARAWMSEIGCRVGDGPEPAARSNGAGDRPKAQPAQAPKAAAAPKGNQPRKIVATYDYHDEAGGLVYQVVRWEPKGFSQRRPDGKGAWIWSLTPGEFMRRGDGRDWVKFDAAKWDELPPSTRERCAVPDEVPHSLYHLTALLEAVAEDELIFLPEGEKDVHTIEALGFAATTNSGGAQHWTPGLARYFKGADVVVPIDNDKAGRERAEILAGALHGVARRVRVLDLAAAGWAGMPEKADISDWVATQGGTAERLADLVASTTPWVPPGFQSKLGLVLWQDMGKPRPPLEYLIKGWLTAGEVSILAGPSGSGKTFLVLDMAMCVARGMSFLGRYRAIEGAVLYQAGEGAKGLTHKRLPAYRIAKGLAWDDALPFATLPRPVDLYHNDDHTNALIEDAQSLAAATGLPVRLIVVDTTSAATPGADENTSKDVSPVLARCNRIAVETGAHVLLVAHMNADKTKVRGHTSWVANVDTVIICRKIENAHDAKNRLIREAEITKQKDGEDGTKIRFVLPSTTIGHDADGDPSTSCTVAEPDTGGVDAPAETAPTGPMIKLAPQAYNFLRAVEEAVSNFGHVAPAGVNSPANVMVVDYEKVREAFEAKSFDGDAEDPKARKAAVRQAVKRNGEALMAKGLIGRFNQGSTRLMWRTTKPLRGRGPAALPPPEKVTPEGRAEDAALLGEGWEGLTRE